MTTKESISKLHAKYYSGGKKKADPVAKLVETKAVDQIKETDLVAKPEGVTATRNNLMLEAKEKGIKNFRILNKQELIACLAHLAEPEYVKKVVDAAKIRWQSGWKKNKVSV